MKSNAVRPFLKWAGGKSQLLKEISYRIPFGTNQDFIYIEPFIGSGAVFFWIMNNYSNIKKAVINDLNPDLINTYLAIANQTQNLIKLLQNLEKEYHTLKNFEEESDYYYSKRNQFNERKSDPTEQSALLIFLNKTCYNGLFRVNRNNNFNVPIGRYKKPLICDTINLLNISYILQKTTILCTDFENTLNYAGKNTFFYFDPPYKPISKSSSFNSYSKDLFDDGEQKRLKLFCDKLHSSNHKWLLSNSDPEAVNQEVSFFDDLYSEYKIERVPAQRRINSNPEKRGFLNELLISNY